MKERIPTIVTSALPYANGPIHIGHLAGAYLPADIYVRFMRLIGEDVIYICGTDEHGTPITFQAQKRGVSPTVIVNEYASEIHHSLLAAGIQFDYFGRTSMSYHYKETQEFFLELLNNGFLETKEEEQFYCSDTKQFLPDRYIEGECPYCGYSKARGDECSRCGKWLEAEKLKNPHSPYCSVDLSKKKTKHWYLSLDKLQKDLESWIETKKDWKDNVVAFVKSWFKEGLHPRAITRDLSWGVPIPLKDEDAQGKVLYVWFDAPIGYLSMTKEWAKEVKKEPNIWEKYWLSENSRLVHFIGKDNIPFHAIVWPAMLIGRKKNFTLPYAIPANEHLTINGEKISSSRGNAVWIEEVVKAFGKDYLRLYLAITSPENKDADFSWEHFGTILNTELVNNLGNLLQRVTSFLQEHFASTIPKSLEYTPEQSALLDKTIKTLQKVKGDYHTFRIKDVCRAIFDLSSEGNVYFQQMEPWKIVAEQKEKVGSLCNVLTQLLEVVGILLLPIIPKGARDILSRIGSPFSAYENLSEYKMKDPYGRKIQKEEPLFPRISAKDIKKHKDILESRMEALVEEEKVKEEKTLPKESGVVQKEMELATIKDFGKLSLQSAKVLEVERVPKSEKLLKFLLQTKDGERQILSGIAEFYPDPQILVGEHIVFVANFPPRMMMGLESNGMILSAENPRGELEVVKVSEKIGVGAIVK